MTKFNRFHACLLFASLFIAHIHTAQADMQQQGYDGYQSGENRTFPPITRAYNPRQQSYGEKVGNKALNAFANMTTSTLEMPKNIINTMNQSNFFYGVFGGFLKGLVNVLGRTGCGIADFVTLPLPTQPIVYPVYIWDDFDVDTTYGEVFRLDENQKTGQPVTEAPAARPVPMAAAVSPPKAAAAGYPNQYDQETNRKLDRVFKQEMQK